MPQKHDIGHRKRTRRNQAAAEAAQDGRYQGPNRTEAEDFARSIVRRGLANPTILDNPRRGHHADSNRGSHRSQA